MELASNLSEKLLDKKDDFYNDYKDYNKKNKVTYKDNIANIHNRKKFDEIDTDKYFNERVQNNKVKKKVNFHKSVNEKEEKYKLLKFKVFNHFFLVIFTMIQAILILNPITKNLRSQERLFYNIFIDNSPKEEDDYSKSIYLYNIDELRNHFKKTILNFYNMDSLILNKINFLRNFTVVEFFYFNEKKISDIDKELFLTSENTNSISEDLNKFNLDDYNDFKNPQGYIDNKITNYKITKTKFGPFSLDNNFLKIFLNDVKYFRVHFKFRIYSIEESTGLDICNEWVENIIFY